MFIKRRHYHNQTPLYEGLYRRMSKLAPALANDIGINGVCLHHDNGTELELKVLERHRFTTIIRITSRLAGDSNYFSDPVFTVRLCHDMRVAEVMAYQSFTRFEADYPYPNENMLHPDEKRQVNRLLAELVDNYLDKNQHTQTIFDNIL